MGWRNGIGGKSLIRVGSTGSYTFGRERRDLFGAGRACLPFDAVDDLSLI